MNDTRTFKRIYHEMDGFLSCAGIINRCKVLNISLTGALVGVKDQLHKVPQRGDSFNLTLYNHIGRQSVCIQTQVAHHGFSLVGLEFVTTDNKTNKFLAEIMEQQAFSIIPRGTQGTDQCQTYFAEL